MRWVPLVLLCACGSDLVVTRTVSSGEARRFDGKVTVVQTIPTRDEVVVRGRFRDGDSLPGGGKVERQLDQTSVDVGIFAVATGGLRVFLGTAFIATAKDSPCVGLCPRFVAEGTALAIGISSIAVGVIAFALGIHGSLGVVEAAR